QRGSMERKSDASARFANSAMAPVATRLAADADRVRLLEDFARRAEDVSRSGLSGAPNRAPPGPRAARYSPAAAKQARYRERLRREVALIPVPVTRAIVSHLGASFCTRQAGSMMAMFSSIARGPLIVSLVR